MKVLYFVLPYSETDSPLFEATDYVPTVKSAVYHHPDPSSMSRDKYVVSSSWVDSCGGTVTAYVMLAK